jgi:hypothetical protein
MSDDVLRGLRHIGAYHLGAGFGQVAQAAIERIQNLEAQLVDLEQDLRDVAALTQAMEPMERLRMVDCNTCANRGVYIELQHQLVCDGCFHQRGLVNHYQPKDGA